MHNQKCILVWYNIIIKWHNTTVQTQSYQTHYLINYNGQQQVLQK